MEDSLFIEVVILIALLVLLRFLFLMHKITTGHTAVANSKRSAPAKIIICIGSGGHTTEMIHLLKTLDFQKYTPRHYIVANSDKTSYQKITALESKKNRVVKLSECTIIEIPRSRVVNQSYFSSIFTTGYSVLYSIPIVCKIRPDLILCNGPGTCIPICVIAFVLRAAFICDSRTIFIESFCRTKTLSLSGKFLVYLADNFLVQWPSLKNKVKRSTYIGQLM